MGSAKQTEHSHKSWDEKELEPPTGVTAALQSQLCPKSFQVLGMNLTAAWERKQRL